MRRLAVTGAERQALSGTYRIGGATFYDSPAEEPQNTHLYVELTGVAARDFYEAMAALPRTVECTGPNVMVTSRSSCWASSAEL